MYTYVSPRSMCVSAISRASGRFSGENSHASSAGERLANAESTGANTVRDTHGTPPAHTDADASPAVSRHAMTPVSVSSRAKNVSVGC